MHPVNQLFGPEADLCPEREKEHKHGTLNKQGNLTVVGFIERILDLKKSVQNPNQEYQDSFVKQRSELELEVISNFGIRGLKACLKYSRVNEHFEHIRFSDHWNASWKLEDSIPRNIDQIWGRVEDKLPHTVQFLRRHCILMAKGRINQKWYLVYCLDVSRYNRNVDGGELVQIVIGGAPAKRKSDYEGVPEWCPDSLKQFYRIHRGFGPLWCNHKVQPNGIWRCGSLLPPYQLEEVRMPYSGAKYYVTFESKDHLSLCVHNQNQPNSAAILTNYRRPNFVNFFTELDELLYHSFTR